MSIDDETKQALEEIRELKKQREELQARRGKWQLVFAIGTIVILGLLFWFDRLRRNDANNPRENITAPTR
jgi:hypothetical protein